MAESILLIGQVGGEFIQVGMSQSGEADAEQDGNSGSYGNHGSHRDRNVIQ